MRLAYVHLRVGCEPAATVSSIKLSARLVAMLVSITVLVRLVNEADWTAKPISWAFPIECAKAQRPLSVLYIYIAWTLLRSIPRQIVLVIVNGPPHISGTTIRYWNRAHPTYCYCWCQWCTNWSCLYTYFVCWPRTISLLISLFVQEGYTLKGAYNI